MKQGYEFIVTSTYDKPAYQALSKASYFLFRRHRTATRAYPALAAMLVLTLGILLFNWSSFPVGGRVGMLIFAALQVIAVPIGEMNAKRKLTKKAIKEARKAGHYPMQIKFVFDHKMIYAIIDGETASSPYEQIDCLIQIGPWRLLFYGQAAYILHASDFSSPEEAERFDKFLVERCGLPFNQMKGAIPQR